MTDAGAALAVGIPTISPGPMLERGLRALVAQEHVAADVLLVENGPAAAGVCAAWEARGVSVHRPGRNLGVAASWNLACRWAWSRGHAAALLLNDDVVLSDRRTLLRLRGELADRPGSVCFLRGRGFSAVCVSRAAWETVGEFDEGFWPAYFEDVDWHRRMALRGVPSFEVDVESEHAGSATIKGDERVHSLVRQTFTRNRDRYTVKWGGPPAAEKFAEPWDGGLPAPPISQ